MVLHMQTTLNITIIIIHHFVVVIIHAQAPESANMIDETIPMSRAPDGVAYANLDYTCQFIVR